MHNSQCGLVHRKADRCTKEPSDGIRYRRDGSGVQNLYWIAFGTPDRAIGNIRQATRLWLIAAEWMYHPYHFEMYQS